MSNLLSRKKENKSLLTLDILINELSEKIDQIFHAKILQSLRDKNVQNDNFVNCLILCALLEKTEFDKKGKLVKKCEKYEIISTVISLFVEFHLSKDWNTVYQKYCSFLRDSTEMLTADEVGCLANFWNVQLKIQFNGAKLPYATYQTLDNSFFHITLSNPSQIHWQVAHDQVAASNAL